tara:strand:+ start:1817 stop:3130 length:1314 start_codon:yes stop_codon:yes gene_type:complete
MYVDNIKDEEYDILFLSRNDSYEGSDSHGLFQIFKYFQDTLDKDCVFVSIFEKHIQRPDNYVIYDLDKQKHVTSDLVEQLPKHKKLIMGDRTDVSDEVLSLIMQKYESELLLVTMVNNAHTGLCSYPTDYGCEKYKHPEGCYNCPDFKQRLLDLHGAATYEKGVGDPDFPNSRFKVHQKFLGDHGAKTTLCAVSTFALEQAAESFLYKDVRKVLTPLKTIIPKQATAKEMLAARVAGKEHVLKKFADVTGQSNFKKICYWSAWDPSMPRKGLDYYVEALHLLCNHHLTAEELRDTAFVFSGLPEKMPFFRSFMPREINKLIYPLFNPDMVSECLYASDLYACTTLEDAGPRTVGEALACGTPVVSFDRCVATDLVDKDCGALVETYDVGAFAAGMAKILKGTDEEGEQYSINAYDSFNRFYNDDNISMAWEMAMSRK